MNAALLAWLEHRGDRLAEQLSTRLLARAGTSFRNMGSEAVRRFANQIIAALRKDITDGGDRAIADVLGRFIDDFGPEGFGHYDLRLLTTSLRLVLLGGFAEAKDVDAEAKSVLEQWLFQVALTGSMYLLAQRERAAQDAAAKIEVRQIESQLVELQVAFEEKTRLLELIRQAATPIAPVYEGVLVVPLVGLIDEQRALALTEKLLATIVQTQARVVIVDVSGVGVFDAATAQHVINTATATKLLGAELILVGLTPNIARTVIELGVDLSGLSTQSTLRAGLSQAMRTMGMCIAPVRALKGRSAQNSP